MIRLTDVAKAAGVSIATASMVLNSGKQTNRVGKDCADRVRLAADRLGYFGNYHARAMQMRRAETLGLALDIGIMGREDSGGALGGEYFTQLIGGVEAMTHKVGYNLAIIGPGDPERAVDRGIRQILQRRLDGLVVVGVLTAWRHEHMLDREPLLPLVMVDYDRPCPVPVVDYAEADGIDQAVRHLAALGHQELLWLGPGPGDTPSRRQQCFMTSVFQAQLRGSTCFIDGALETTGAATAALGRRLREQPRTFTAIMAYNDLTAIGAYGALRDHGLVVPRDVSVIGFDDFHGHLVHPRLTTVSHMLPAMGRRAAELILEMAADPEGPERRRGYREVLSAPLVVRDSTGPASDPGRGR